MAYTAVPLQLEEHREELLRVWKRNMSDPHIERVADERLRWYYDENPAGRPFTSLGVDEESRSIIGCGSFLRRGFVVNGRLWAGGILSDFAVDQEHRSAGPAVAIQRLLAADIGNVGVDFLIAYPSKPAEAIFKRVGHKLVGVTATWVKPLRSHREVRKRLRESPLSGVISRVYDQVLAAADSTRRARLKASAAWNSYSGSLVDCADPRFDDLWERGRAQQTVAGERSASYLNWRYRDFKSAEYSFFTLTDRKTGRLAAYIVYALNSNNAAVIADLFCEDFDAQLEPLMLRFASTGRRLGWDSIRAIFLGSDSYGDRLARLGFVSRPGDRSVFAYLPPRASDDLKNALLDGSNWFMFDAELDI